MATVSYHDTVNVLQAVAQEPAGPFERAEWFALLGPALVAFASEQDRRAALVLRQAGGRLEALRNWYSFTWRPLGAPDLWPVLARDLRRRAHRVTLWPLPSSSGTG
ncbi:MAG: hypothetical protein ACEQR8_09055, partial [Cypionkella sp.]